MTKAMRYRCPGTVAHPAHEFTYTHHPSILLDPLPRFCGICGYDSNGDPVEPALTTPHIGLTIRKTVDDMHRQMEVGAEHRANIAMEHFGLDSSDAAVMRETNSRDSLRMGDTSDAPVNNPITQMMEAAPPGLFGFRDAGSGVGFSESVSTGPHPNVGARTQMSLRRLHRDFTSTSGMASSASSSMPALETVAPGYRARVRE
jgi:hypothetical protein